MHFSCFMLTGYHSPSTIQLLQSGDVWKDVLVFALQKTQERGFKITKICFHVLVGYQQI
jgi:hypothetical protein